MAQDNNPEVVGRLAYTAQLEEPRNASFVREASSAMNVAEQVTDEISSIDDMFESGRSPRAQLEHPIATIAKSIRRELHSFVIANMRENAAMGLREEFVQPINIGAVIKVCRQALKGLERVIQAEVNEPEQINLQICAANLQARTESFLLQTYSRRGNADVSEQDRLWLAGLSIEFKESISELMLKLKSLRFSQAAS